MVELIKLLGSVAAIYHLLGPWGTLIAFGVLAALCGVLYFYGGNILEWVILHHARALGKALNGATVTVHAITAVPEPDRSVWIKDAEDEEFEADLEASGMPEGKYDWYHIDVTITPKSPDANVEAVAWEPGMVHFCKADRKLEALEIDVHCLIAQVEWWQGGKFEECDSGMAYGTKRLRFYAGFEPGTDQVKLHYLGHIFGDLRLPWARQPHAAAAR
jgi:hypothetical protein